MERICNECGYPLNGNDKVCPECGNLLNTPNTDSTTVNYDNDYNETLHYSPLKENCWLFTTPSYLESCPRGEFASRHPFWGWLLGPWHIANENNEDKEYINVVNNIFYLLNQCFKAWLYVPVWIFLKSWYIFIIGFGGVIFCAASGEEMLGILGIIILVLLYILGGILSICGILASIQRYSSPIIRSFRRIRKRHWMSMYRAIKYNNLNLD